MKKFLALATTLTAVLSPTAVNAQTTEDVFYESYRQIVQRNYPGHGNFDDLEFKRSTIRLGYSFCDLSDEIGADAMARKIFNSLPVDSDAAIDLTAYLVSASMLHLCPEHLETYRTYVNQF